MAIKRATGVHGVVKWSIYGLEKKISSGTKSNISSCWYATVSSDHVMEEGRSWDWVRGRLQQAKERHSFCEPQNPQIPERDTLEREDRRTVSTWDFSTDIDNATLAERKHWDVVSRSLRVCGFFVKGDRDVRGHKKKRSRWDKVRHHHVVTNDLESTALQSPRTISSASTELAVVLASSRTQVVQGLLTVESEDPTACPAELDASRWKEGWLRRKNSREKGQGGFHKTRSTSAPFVPEPGLIRPRHGARHIMARSGGSPNRPRGLVPHGSSFPLAGLTSYYKFVKAKYPHVRASSS